MSSVHPVEASAMPSCWSCHGPIDARAPLCATCGAVLPPAAADPFERLGFDYRYDIDLVALDRRYFDLQRRLHPDRFAGKGPHERAYSQQQAAAINDAYQTLKDPLARAASLLRRAGRKIDIHGQGTTADPVLLNEAMEMREALAEADSPAETERLTRQADDALAAGREALADAFARGDLDTAEHQVLRLRYLGKLIEDARLRRRALA
jgi:molecular chaperone HscB